jgi:hypothetical protein
MRTEQSIRDLQETESRLEQLLRYYRMAAEQAAVFVPLLEVQLGRCAEEIALAEMGSRQSSGVSRASHS